MQCSEEHSVSSKFQNLTLNMFENEPFPCLKGKAAEIRHLGPALLSAFQENMNHADQIQRQVALALKLVCRMEELVDENKEFYKWPQDVAQEFEKCTVTFCKLSTAVGNHLHVRGIMLFNYTIKYHYLLHIGLLCHHMNPVLAWCYQGEDMMKIVKGLIQSCHNGSAPHLAVVKTMTKCVNGLGHDLMQGAIWRV